MTLSQRIKQLRNQRKIDLLELAQRSELDETIVSGLETNRASVTVELLVKIAKAFQMSLRQLLEGVEFNS